MLNCEERSLNGRAAAHALHAKHQSQHLTAPGTAAFLAKFEDEVDPMRVLPPEERRRRAAHALKAYMARLALKSAQVRRDRADRGAADQLRTMVKTIQDLIDPAQPGEGR